MLSAAKGIAGGFPMGAILARESVARLYLTAGSHGTTFGGNPLACAAANAVLDVILAPGFLDGVVARRRAGCRKGCEALVREHPDVFAGVRGTGLMLGLVCEMPNTEVQKACRGGGAAKRRRGRERAAPRARRWW